MYPACFERTKVCIITVQTGFGAHAAPYLMGTGWGGALYPVVKQPGREADHSSPTSAEVKKTWIYTSTPPIRLHGAVLSELSTGTTLP
jgi:hypothetical protein